MWIVGYMQYNIVVERGYMSNGVLTLVFLCIGFFGTVFITLLMIGFLLDRIANKHDSKLINVKRIKIGDIKYERRECKRQQNRY